MVNTEEMIITIAICVFATMLTRFLPFLIFREGKEVPDFVKYLGDALPAALFAFLVVYCLKDVNILTGSHGIPELISIAAVVLVHLKWKNMFLSIIIGTVLYMLLIQFVFV